MNRDLIRMVGTILLAGAAMLVVLPACGGSAGGSTAALATPQATATSQPTAPATPTATVAPAPLTPTAAPATNTPSTGPSDSDLLAQGKLIFEKTAGGVGCAYCHGLDGKGKATSGAGTPDIRGAAEVSVRAALAGGAPVMSFIKLSDEEIKAVVAYLQYLSQQP